MKYDLIVIGGGSGGLSVAKASAGYGARVAIVDHAQVGGTCVNRGCIPKKLMIDAALFVGQQKTAASFHWVNLTGVLDWESFKATLHHRLKDLRQSQHEKLEQAGIEWVAGSAALVDEHTVQVGDRTLQADYLVLAVGSHPNLPDMTGAEHALTSDDMFDLPQIPRNLVIVGGGYIGVEFSHIFAQLGAKVTLADKGEKPLAGFDNSLQTATQEGLDRLGVTFVPNVTCEEIKLKGNQRIVHLVGETSQSILADVVLIATGRKPNLEGLQLENAGVQVEQGKIVVDDHYRTSQDSIYAIGDCVARMPLTPVAIAEGKAVAKTVFQHQPTTVNYHWVPSAVFGHPPVASVGWTEEIAKDRLGEDVEIHCEWYTPLDHSLEENPQQSLIKWVICKSSQEILGVHMVDPKAPEILQGLIPALKQGLKKGNLFTTSGIHPTNGEELFVLS